MSATNKAKNDADKLVGKAKEMTGRIVGNERLEDEGRQDQSKSDLKNAAEKVKDAFKH